MNNNFDVRAHPQANEGIEIVLCTELPIKKDSACTCFAHFIHTTNRSCHCRKIGFAPIVRTITFQLELKSNRPLCKSTQHLLNRLLCFISKSHRHILYFLSCIRCRYWRPFWMCIVSSECFVSFGNYFLFYYCLISQRWMHDGRTSLGLLRNLKWFCSFFFQYRYLVNSNTHQFAFAIWVIFALSVMHRVPKTLIALWFNPTINRTLHVQQMLLQFFVCNAEDE